MKLISAFAIGAIALSACGSKAPESGVTMGNENKFDTLSYVIGMNLGGSLTQQFADVPFNMELVEQGIEKTALGSFTKEDLKVGSDALRDYFTKEYRERKSAIMADRMKQDSTRKANGDTTIVEYPVADEAMFESEQERNELSSHLGEDIGQSLQSAGFPLQLVWVNKGMEDFAANDTKIDQQAAMMYFQNYVQVELPKIQQKKEQEFLSKIEKQSGVKKTESGLLYTIEEQGDMNTVITSDNDVFVAHYLGTNSKGVKFDSSYDRNDPLEMPIGNVIKGWGEGMRLIGKGGKITLWIPSALGYGSQARSAEIPAYEPLKFEIELIDVKPATPVAPAQPAE